MEGNIQTPGNASVKLVIGPLTRVKRHGIGEVEGGGPVEVGERAESEGGVNRKDYLLMSDDK